METVRIDLPELVKENKLLAKFHAQAKEASELERYRLAKTLADDWTLFHCDRTVFPGNPEVNDFWYLVQLFALNRHVSQKGKTSPSVFFAPIELTLSLPLPKENFSRDEIDHKIRSGEPTVRLIRFDEFLRCNKLLSEFTQERIHIDGYWESPTEGKIGLFAGRDTEVGFCHIDAIWNTTKLKSVRCVLVEEQKEEAV